MATVRVAGSPIDFRAAYGGAASVAGGGGGGGAEDGPAIPHMLSPSPRLDDAASAAPRVTKHTPLPPSRRPTVASPMRADGIGVRLKPMQVRPERVCGLAPQLLATHPESMDVLTTYAMLQAQRQQGFARAAVWYASAVRALGLKSCQPAVLATCDASDHLTHGLAPATPPVPTSEPRSPSANAGESASDVDANAAQGTHHRGSGAIRPAVVEPAGTVLDISGMYLGLRGLLVVISTIPLLPHLVAIRASNVGLDSTTLALLCHACCALPALRSLDVSHNAAAGSHGAEALAALAARLPTLVEVRDDGLEAIGPVHRRLHRRLAANRDQAMVPRARSDGDDDDDVFAL